MEKPLETISKFTFAESTNIRSWINNYPFWKNAIKTSNKETLNRRKKFG